MPCRPMESQDGQVKPEAFQSRLPTHGRRFVADRTDCVARCGERAALLEVPTLKLLAECKEQYGHPVALAQKGGPDVGWGRVGVV